MKFDSITKSKKTFGGINESKMTSDIADASKRQKQRQRYRPSKGHSLGTRWATSRQSLQAMWTTWNWPSSSRTSSSWRMHP